jgi:hypothetical protein
MTTTTENNTNDKELDTLKEGVVNDTETMLEEGKLGGDGIRKRLVNNGAALSVKALSRTSKMFDVDGDGKLDDAEKAMRDMDTENDGYLPNWKVYQVMVEQMRLQQEVFSLKRMSLFFLSLIVLLTLATLGTSFAAATLAKETNVVKGNLVAKDGSGVVGTSNVSPTFTIGEGASPGEGRRTQDTTFQNGGTEITKSDADLVWTNCNTGTAVNLKKRCSETLSISVPFCTDDWNDMINTEGQIYAFALISDATKFNRITCDGETNPCQVEFATGTPVCPVPPIDAVNLGAAGNYAILAKTGISTVPASVITGDIAVSPIAGAAITGFNLAMDSGLAFSTDANVQIIGKAFAPDYTGGSTASDLTTAVNDMGAAYSDAAGRTNSDAARINLEGGALNGHVLTPGVYTFGTNLQLTGHIHFEGSPEDIFIIQISGNLIQSANFQVILDSTWLGKPLAGNIFWQVAGHATINAGAHMKGTLLVKNSVTFVTASSLEGRIMAQTLVALQMATITETITP